MQELCPTRIRVLMSVYDFSRTMYRTMPGAYVNAVVANANEGKRLLSMLRTVIVGGKWQDKRDVPRITS